MGTVKLFCLTMCTIIFGIVYAEGSYVSRNGQDKFLNEEIFNNKTAGVFIDIGAYDGVFENNTYFFEKKLGWIGICVEPLVRAYGALIKNRSCECMCGAVAACSGKREFVEVYGRFPYMSGFVNTYYIQNWKIINLEDLHKGGWRIIMVPTYTLNDICAARRINHIDYVSISTQGSEEEIIKSIDFAGIDITVLSVENSYGRLTTEPYLISKGYRLIARVGATDMYLKKELV